MHGKCKRCELCGSDKDICKHHFDYKKPMEIIYLCVICHNRLHRGNLNKEKRLVYNKLVRKLNEGGSNIK